LKKIAKIPPFSPPPKTRLEVDKLLSTTSRKIKYNNNNNNNNNFRLKKFAKKET
jgi:hypothetical protein